MALMNPEAKEILDKILAKSPQVLTEDEIGFLRARRTYLKPSQIEEYKSVLGDQTSQKEPVKQNDKSRKTN